jgi:hypothetical protein
MAAKIALSAVRALDFDFTTVVAAYKQQLAEFAARPADWDPIPPPHAPHPLVAVAAAVDSYEIHDDTPPPPAPPSLEERKHALAGEVQRLGDAAIAQIFPALKRPLMDLDHQDALQTPEADRSQGQRDVINNRKGLEERARNVRRRVAEILHRIADMDEAAFEAFAKAPAQAIEG